LKAGKNKKINIRSKLFAHLETWRPYTVIWCGLVSLSGASIVYNGLPPLKISLLTLFIPMMGWTAGLYLSDFLDRKLDRIQKPHRPIPSGRIKPKEALFIGGIFALLGFLLSFLLSIYNILLVFAVAAIVFLYAKISKSRGLLGNINRGIATAAAYFFGVFSIGQEIQSIPFYIWILSLVFLIHDTNSNLVGAIRDIEGDKKGGYDTYPVRYGLKKSIIFSSILTTIWLSLTLYLPYYYNFMKNGYNFYIFMILDVLILSIFYIYLISSLKNYSRKKALNFHEFFVIERITLASAFLFGFINVSIAITLYFTAIIITALSQIILRKRYEFSE